MWLILFLSLFVQAASALDYGEFKGRTAYTEEETRKNFEAVSRFVLPGVPLKSRLLVMPLAHEAGGTEFHPGGKHWESQADPEWKTLADWVNRGK
jgi:hypothetical protein